jgi:flagellar protein FlaG
MSCRLSQEVDLNISSIGGPVSAPVEPAPARQLTDQQRSVVQAVKAVNSANLFGQNSQLTYVVDPASKRVVVRIVDRETGKLVEQIPAEYVLRLAEEVKGR